MEIKVERKEQGENNPVPRNIRVVLLGLYLVVIAVLLVYLFQAFWPREIVLKPSEETPKQEETINQTEETQEEGSTLESTVQPAGTEQESSTTGEETEKKEEQEITEWTKHVRMFGFEFEIPHEVRLIILVLIAGAIGSYIHAVSSFVDYVGNKVFTASWTWWYLLVIFRGSTLALIFYLIVRGGLFTSEITGTDLSRFSVTGLAGMIGLFSKQAIDKLSELFDMIFMTKDKVHRENSLPKDPQQGQEPTINLDDKTTAKKAGKGVTEE